MLSWSHKYIDRAGRQPGWEQSRMLWDRAGWCIQEDNTCMISVGVTLCSVKAVTQNQVKLSSSGFIPARLVKDLRNKEIELLKKK